MLNLLTHLILHSLLCTTSQLTVLYPFTTVLEINKSISGWILGQELFLELRDKATPITLWRYGRLQGTAVTMVPPITWEIHPGFPSDSSPKLWDKIQDGKPGFEASSCSPGFISQSGQKPSPWRISTSSTQVLVATAVRVMPVTFASWKTRIPMHVIAKC